MPQQVYYLLEPTVEMVPANIPLTRSLSSPGIVIWLPEPVKDPVAPSKWPVPPVIVALRVKEGKF